MPGSSRYIELSFDVSYRTKKYMKYLPFSCFSLSLFFSRPFFVSPWLSVGGTTNSFSSSKGVQRALELQDIPSGVSDTAITRKEETTAGEDESDGEVDDCDPEHENR